MSFLISRAKRSCCFVWKARRSIESPEIALLERFVIFCSDFALSPFSIATTNLLNRSVFSISVSDVDSDYSLRLEDSEAEGENDEWSVVLQVGIL